MTDEFDPDTPGPPREVAEDATARERSMTAEEWARELAWTISGTTFHGHDDFVHKVRAIATKTIAKAQSQAHAAGKAEGAAEERAACLYIIDSQAGNPMDSYETVAVLDHVTSLIRQRSEASDDVRGSKKPLSRT